MTFRTNDQNQLRSSPRLMILSGAVAATLLSAAALRAAPTGDAALDATIAERLALIADDSVVSDATPDAELRQAAALLDLAREMNPKEVRFARSSASVLLRLGESKRALDALSQVRALDPKDQLAMIQYIDLTANAMESADGRATYLQQVVDAKGISAEVRSHAAVTLMDLLYQRAEDARAGEVLETALALNPQNIAALATKYQMASSSGSIVGRAHALADLVQASPVNTKWLSLAARECVAAGDYDGAHGFTELLFSVYFGSGKSPGVDDLISIAGAELLGGSSTDISGLMKQGLQSVKDDGRLYAIDLLISQFDGKKIEDLAPEVALARGVYLAQLASVSQLLNTPDQKEMPTTNPAAPFPDVAADVAKLTASDPSGLKTAYTISLAEQLWFDLYFRAATVDDASIAALATLLGTDTDPLIVRLQGWKLLSAGQTDEAKVKFSAVADRDGYAKLGLAAVAMAQGKADEAKATLGELFATRPEGILSAYLGVAAKLADVKQPQTAAEQEVAKIFSPVRKPITDLLRNPRSAYLMTAAPVNVSFGPGDVLLARVTIQNNGRVPLTIGPGCLVDPQFVIDVQTRGDAPRGFPGAAVGKWWGAVRLLPQQSFSQVVRVDRGSANAFFRSYPTPPMTVTANITSNPISTQRGNYPGPAGQQSAVGNVMERRSSPLFVEGFRTKVIDNIANGSPVDRLNAIELSTTVLPMLDKQSDNEDAKKVAAALRAAVDAQIEKEPVADVKAWALLGRATSGDVQQASNDMTAVSSMPSPGGRLVALLACRRMPMDQRQRLSQHILENSTEPAMIELAKAVHDQKDPPPPTTAPAAAAPSPDAPAAP